MAHHGGWHWAYLPYRPPSVPPGVAYMGDCAVWRPSWSSCYGCCGKTFDNVSTSITEQNYYKSCETCRSVQQGVWYPNPYCFVVRLSPFTYGMEMLSDPLMDSSYVIRLAHGCGCYGCEGMPADRRVTIDAARTPGLVPPPPKSPAEKVSLLMRAAEFNFEIEMALRKQGVTVNRWGGKRGYTGNGESKSGLEGADGEETVNG